MSTKFFSQPQKIFPFLCRSSVCPRKSGNYKIWLSLG